LIKQQAAASAGPLDTSSWLSVALGKMKRCGVECPVALIQNIRATLMSVSPLVSYSEEKDIDVKWAHDNPV
jgi:hypothetical protein